jgi:predicted DsbA family dithiol-disulfide isomerase
MGIAQSVDLDPQEARTVIEQGQYKDAVDRDWQRSRNMGITAVPTFVMNRQRLVGAQTYQDLTRFIQSEI